MNKDIESTYKRVEDEKSDDGKDYVDPEVRMRREILNGDSVFGESDTSVDDWPSVWWDDEEITWCFLREAKKFHLSECDR